MTATSRNGSGWRRTVRILAYLLLVFLTAFQMSGQTVAYVRHRTARQQRVAGYFGTLCTNVSAAVATYHSDRFRRSRPAVPLLLKSLLQEVGCIRAISPEPDLHGVSCHRIIVSSRKEMSHPGPNRGKIESFGIVVGVENTMGIVWLEWSPGDTIESIEFLLPERSEAGRRMVRLASASGYLCGVITLP